MRDDVTDVANGQRRAPVWPVPGVVLGRGRYRLIERTGADERCSAQLWRGRDAVLERDVALTVFTAPAEDVNAAAIMRAEVTRALRSARLETPGAARVLDVLEPDPSPGTTVAAVVAEWTPGRDLIDVVREGLPAPSVAASMLAPLAGAVDAAHRAGLVLGCDHPRRIRVTPEGHVRLAFPGPPAEASSRDDVSGLGAVLYLLLTGRWPLASDAGGLPLAATGPNGATITPKDMRPDVPLELSTLAMRSLGGGAGAAGVHTGAAVRRVLELNATSADDASLLPADRPDPVHTARSRRRKLAIGVGVLVVASLLVITYLGSQVLSIFTGTGADAPPPVIVGNQSTPVAPPGGAPPDDAPAPPAGATVVVTDEDVYDVSGQGSPDNVDDVALVVDGDPTTGWATDSYRQQFPAYKEGLGVLLTLEQATALSAVSVESPSAGTVVEIRSAPDADAEFDDTTLLGSATLGTGRTTIELDGAEPTRYVLVWITTLAGDPDAHSSEIGEITLQRAD